MATIVEQAKAQMAKSVESTKENFSGIRTGRANPALLNGITVDYYGAPTPLKAVATIGVPEPRTLSVTPFDAKPWPIWDLSPCVAWQHEYLYLPRKK